MTLFAQQNKIDSLLILLKTTQEDTTKINIYNNLFFQVEFSDSAKAKEYLDKAFTLAQKIDFKKGLAATFTLLGYFAEDKGNYPEALKNHFASLKITETISDTEGIARSYNGISNVYLTQGNCPEALKNLFACLKINETIGDKKEIAGCYNNIGGIYDMQGNYPEALKNFFASLKIRETIGDKKGIAGSYNNIGSSYYSQGNYPEALKNLFASLKIYETLGNKKGIAYNYDNIGNVYDKQGNYPEALKNLFASLKIYETLGDKQGSARSYCNIGVVFTKQKKYPEAGQYLIKAEELSKQIGVKDILKETYSALATLDSAKGNCKGAYQNYKLYIIYRDSIDNETTREKTIQSQMTYDFEKKEAATQAEQDKKDIVAKEELKQKERQRNYFIIGLALVGLLSIFIFRGFKQKQKAAILENIVLEQKLLRTQMNPHFIFNILSSIQNFIYKDKKDEAHTYVGKFAKLMRSILENSREEFVSMEKEMKTLEHYLSLNQLLLDNKFNFKIDVDKNIDIEHTQIPPMLAQPFIENALKHGIQNKEEPGFIKISFKQIDTKNIQFEVEDNGIGFTKVITAEAIEHKSFATTITQERLGNLYNNKNVVISITEVRNRLNEIIGTKTFFTIPYRYT